MDLVSLLTCTYTLILLIVLALSFVSLALYYGLFYLRVGIGKESKISVVSGENEAKLPSVSVVLVTHNEAAYLKDNLVYLLEQDYPNFEVVVVDHVSTDDTSFVLQLLEENYPALKTISFKEDINFFSGKKYPLSIGIRSAKNDVILLTEPDSVPKSFNWIRSMVAGYMHNASIVIGYSGLRQEKGFLNSLMQYDNLHFMAHAFGFALMGNPMTATGRNLSYKRQFFFDRGAFTRHYAEPEGADDLFVNQNANKRNTRIQMNEDSFVQTEPRATFSQWVQQRRARFASKKYYGVKDKMLSMIHPVSVFAFYLPLILLMVFRYQIWWLWLAVLAVLWTWHIISFAKLQKRFGVNGVQWFAPLYEIYFLFANTISYLFTLRKKK